MVEVYGTGSVLESARAHMPAAAAGHPQQMAKASKKTAGQAATDPCGPGRGSPNGSPYGSNPCNPVSK